MADPSKFLLACLQELSEAELQRLCRVVDGAFDKLQAQLVLYEASFSALRSTVCATQNKKLELTDEISNISSVVAALDSKDCSSAVRDLILLRSQLGLVQTEFTNFINDVLVLPALVAQQSVIAARILSVTPLIDFMRGFRNILRFRLGVC